MTNINTYVYPDAGRRKVVFLNICNISYLTCRECNWTYAHTF
jgi:hypothetical protein